MGQVETGDTVAYCPDPPLTDRWLCRGGGVNRRAATTAKPPLLAVALSQLVTLSTGR